MQTRNSAIRWLPYKMRRIFVGIVFLSAFSFPVILPAQQTTALVTYSNPSLGSSVNLWNVNKEVKDNSKPFPVHLKWIVNSQCPPDVVFDVYLSKTERFTETILSQLILPIQTFRLPTLRSGLRIFGRLLSGKKEKFYARVLSGSSRHPRFRPAGLMLTE